MRTSAARWRGPTWPAYFNGGSAVALGQASEEVTGGVRCVGRTLARAPHYTLFMSGIEADDDSISGHPTALPTHATLRPLSNQTILGMIRDYV